MAEKLQLVLVMHNHQPPGNSDATIAECYHRSYEPVLSLLARFPEVRASLHTSGCLYDWLEAHRPEYLDRLMPLVALGQIDVLGGAYSDPILPAISPEERVSQISRYGEKLSDRFGYRPRGMWIAERVWEPCLAGDLAAAGIEHTVLDDVHFRDAGLTDDQLRGYWLTDDNAPPVALFAGNERLRYMIPFAEPHEVIAYLRDVWTKHPGGIIVYADDGEKFGAWPGMFERCFELQWLQRFFEALTAERGWLHVTTMREVVDRVAPLGKVYLPDSSYREMNAWSAIDASGQREAIDAHLAERETTDLAVRGTWRNFRVKYPAADEMHARMQLASRRLRAAERQLRGDDRLAAARRHLDLAQCGCAYWHGVYGGVYLPHLRQAVYRNLIAADEIIDAATSKDVAWVEATIDDFNSDVHREVLLANDRLRAFFDPERGGMLYELDVREAGANVLATFARRPEPYHPTTDRRSPVAQSQGPSSDRSAPMVYDAYPRKSLLDHFFDTPPSLAALVAGRVAPCRFVQGRYQRKLRRNSHRVELVLTRTGSVAGSQVTVTKTIALAAESSELDIQYEIEGLPSGKTHFAVEFNVASLGSEDHPPTICDEHG